MAVKHPRIEDFKHISDLIPVETFSKDQIYLKKKTQVLKQF